MGTLGSNRGGPGSLKRGFGGFEEGGGARKQIFVSGKYPKMGNWGQNGGRRRKKADWGGSKEGGDSKNGLFWPQNGGGGAPKLGVWGFKVGG